MFGPRINGISQGCTYITRAWSANNLQEDCCSDNLNHLIRDLMKVGRFCISSAPIFPETNISRAGMEKWALRLSKFSRCRKRKRAEIGVYTASRFLGLIVMLWEVTGFDWASSLQTICNLHRHWRLILILGTSYCFRNYIHRVVEREKYIYL